MKHLVEELRAGAELEEAYDEDGIIRVGYQKSLRWRAADEIERLNALLQQAVSARWPPPPEWYEAAQKALGRAQ